MLLTNAAGQELSCSNKTGHRLTFNHIWVMFELLRTGHKHVFCHVRNAAAGIFMVQVKHTFKLYIRMLIVIEKLHSGLFKPYKHQRVD